MTVLLVLPTIMALMIGHWFLTQYVLPDKWVASYAQLANVPRRHLESLNAWNTRALAAYNKRSDAERDFIAESLVLSMAQANGERGVIYRLPNTNPAYVALLCAQHPDGPSLEELRALAGIKDQTSEHQDPAP